MARYRSGSRRSDEWKNEAWRWGVSHCDTTWTLDPLIQHAQQAAFEALQIPKLETEDAIRECSCVVRVVRQRGGRTTSSDPLSSHAGYLSISNPKHPWELIVTNLFTKNGACTPCRCRSVEDTPTPCIVCCVLLLRRRSTVLQIAVHRLQILRHAVRNPGKVLVLP